MNLDSFEKAGPLRQVILAGVRYRAIVGVSTMPLQLLDTFKKQGQVIVAGVRKNFIRKMVSGGLKNLNPRPLVWKK
jgi:hypothetical protein